MEAVIHLPGEGERREMGSNVVFIKATSDDTDGKFFLMESTIAPGFPGRPPHTHEQLYDMFYVLDGTLTVRLRSETTHAPPGTFVLVPPGVVHTFSNASDAPVRILNFKVPGGWEHYMRDLSEAGKAGLSQEEIAKIASKHDFKPV